MFPAAMGPGGEDFLTAGRLLPGFWSFRNFRKRYANGLAWRVWDGARMPRVDSLAPTGEHPIHANSDTSDDMVGPALGRLPRYRRPELAHGGSVRQFGLRRLRHRPGNLQPVRHLPGTSQCRPIGS